MKIKRSYRYLTEAAKRNSIPEPYSKYYEIDTEGEKDFPDMLGEVIDGYGCKILHYLIAKSEYEDILDEPEAFLVDDPDYPVVVTAGRRMYPVELPELNESLNEDATSDISSEEMFDFLDDLGGYTDYDGRIDALVDEFGISKEEAENTVWNWTLKNEDSEDEEDTDEDDAEEDDEESSNWLKVISKPVPDADGFLTDYTMYRDLDDPEHYVFVFGDNELYSPDDGDWDYEAFSNEEATEWYNNYEGFTEEDEDEE